MVFFSFKIYCQDNIDDKQYLSEYGIDKDSIKTLNFKNKDLLMKFIHEFEDKKEKGFSLPKFLIYDETGNLIKHKLDIYIKECGKGDVNELKKRYHKKQPSIDRLNSFFIEDLSKPKNGNFVVIFIWMNGLELQNKHTFETYKTWKRESNLKTYFIKLDAQD
jgi:hypothetical protein